MDADAYRDFQLLTEIASGDAVTQRGIAKRYRLALGLTNVLIRRLVAKGYVKVISLDRKRRHYLVTPEGLTEKARLTRAYLECSLDVYRALRMFLARPLSMLPRDETPRIVLYGTDEAAEIMVMILQQHHIPVHAVVDEPSASPRSAFMDRPIMSAAELASVSYDWIVVAALDDAPAAVERLRRWGVPDSKIITVADHVMPPAGVPVNPEILLDARRLAEAGRVS